MPRGYAKAEAVQAVGRTDANLAPMRMNAVALFGGWVIRSLLIALPAFAWQWFCIDMAHLRNAYETVTSLSLSLWLAGASASPVPVVMDAIDPWQNPRNNSVEAVELCSRPLLYRQSWCVHFWVAFSR